MTANAQKFWDRVSRMSRGPEKLGASARKIVEAAQGYLNKESVVLDVGCGPGGVSMAIARHVAAVHAIDSSAGMVEAAKASAVSLGALNVHFAQECLADVADRGDMFTAVTLFNVLPYLHDIPEALRQIEALLAPGGVLLSSTACLGERKSLLAGLTWILAKLRIMPNARSFRRTELEELFAGGGLQIVAMQRVSDLPEYFVVARKAAESLPVDASSWLSR